MSATHNTGIVIGSPTPTSGNDEVEAMRKRLERIKRHLTEPVIFDADADCDAIDQTKALLHKQAAQIIDLRSDLMLSKLHPAPTHSAIQELEAQIEQYQKTINLQEKRQGKQARALREKDAQIAELQTERAEILRISGLVWPPSAAIAGKEAG